MSQESQESQESTARTARDYWTRLEARDWEAWGALLADDVVARWPQTAERVTGREALVRYNQHYPGDWHLRVERVVADRSGAGCLVASTLDGEPMPATTFFTFDESGLIATITEFWPERYDLPESRAGLAEQYASEFY